jgi:toxin ParE1/3/4
LDEQAGYLAREASLETALRFYDAAAATFEKLARMPGIGERRDSTKPRLAELRVWRVEGFEKHLILYRLSGTGIDIVRVFHGARDIDRVLDSDRFDREPSPQRRPVARLTPAPICYPIKLKRLIGHAGYPGDGSTLYAPNKLHQQALSDANRASIDC